mmetsp:Transcript_13421/g.25193  ORF Transcript_13421/g.25193 Transcript_13421/m.25193 type:complete len:211 (+) Transcript_13421:3124-3756(+)
MKTLQLFYFCTHISQLLAFMTGYTQHHVTLKKPMGIILESDEQDNNEEGIIIKQIDPLGNTASACRDNPQGIDICIRDRIIQVDNVDVSNNKSLEDVMKLIINGPNETVHLVLGRPKDAIVMKWWNGISVAVNPGERVKDIARYEACVKIKYSCDTGGCGICECSMLTVGQKQEGQGDQGRGSERYFRPCVARVPKGPSMIWVKPSGSCG